MVGDPEIISEWRVIRRCYPQCARPVVSFPFACADQLPVSRGASAAILAPDDRRLATAPQHVGPQPILLLCTRTQLTECYDSAYNAIGKIPGAGFSLFRRYTLFCKTTTRSIHP